MKKRIAALLLALVMAFSLIPATVFAEEDHTNQVHVIVENTTFTKAQKGGKAPAWTGTLVEEWVALSNDSTVMTCVVAALDKHNYTQTGAESGYISEINGLAQFAGGSESGWMGTLNDWFTNEGLSNFTVRNGTLAAGDEIRIMYTSNGYGADLGGSWDNNDKTVKALTFSAGTLDKEFNKDTHEYTLTVPADVTAVKVTPTASNKNFQVRTSVGKIEYKRTAMVPVKNDTVITVKCGDPSWPSMNDNVGEAQIYTITVKTEGETPVTPPADAQNVTFKGLHDAQLKYLKVYRVGDETTNLLKGLERIADGYKYKYETKLSPGEYLVKGYDENDEFNGSLVLTVKEGENVFHLARFYEIYASNSGWVKDTDYTISVKVKDAEGNDLKAETGTATSWGNTSTSCLYMPGGTVTITLTPIGEKAEGYLPYEETVITKADDSAKSFNKEIPKASAVTVHAPAGSTISAGVFRNYWTYEFVEATSETKGNEGVTGVYTLPVVPSTDGYLNYHNHFVRVQHPDGVTYWTFGKWNEATEITVTKDDLHIGDSSFTKSSVIDDFSRSKYDLGSIYLNINSQGYKNMAVGETFTLNTFRNWQAIESYMNAKIALPDVHYRVVDVNGNDSNVLAITPDANNSGLATVTAKQAGTAIVLVTYDAMTHAQGYEGTDLSAIWPEFTGVFVVTVGQDGTGIQTNMTMERPTSKATTLDAEHDILFYLGSKGASYSFKPEDGCTVTVARSTVGSAMSFNGFTADGVSVAADGTVTVKGLTTGRHIIRVEKNGVAAYQVVTARGVSYDLLDADGKKLADDAELKPGDTVKIQFRGLVNPIEKMAGVYNRVPLILMVGEDGTKYISGKAGISGVYTFSSDPALQQITITIPESVTGITYKVSGAIQAGKAFGLVTGAHRGAAYNIGSSSYTSTVGDILSQLPEVALKLVGYNEIQAPVDKVEDMINAIGTVSKDSGKALAAARAAYNALNDEQKALVPEEVLKALEKAEADYAKLLNDSKYEPNPLKPGNNSSAKNPYQKDNKTDTKADSKDVKSGNTGDAGIALYVGMGLLAAMGGAVVIGRKKKAN